MKITQEYFSFLGSFCGKKTNIGNYDLSRMVEVHRHRETDMAVTVYDTGYNRRDNPDDEIIYLIVCEYADYAGDQQIDAFIGVKINGAAIPVPQFI